MASPLAGNVHRLARSECLRDADHGAITRCLVAQDVVQARPTDPGRRGELAHHPTAGHDGRAQPDWMKPPRCRAPECAIRVRRPAVRWRRLIGAQYLCRHNLLNPRCTVPSDTRIRSRSLTGAEALTPSTLRTRSRQPDGTQRRIALRWTPEAQPPQSGRHWQMPRFQQPMSRLRPLPFASMATVTTQSTSFHNSSRQYRHQLGTDLHGVRAMATGGRTRGCVRPVFVRCSYLDVRSRPDPLGLRSICHRPCRSAQENPETRPPSSRVRREPLTAHTEEESSAPASAAAGVVLC